MELNYKKSHKIQTKYTYIVLSITMNNYLVRRQNKHQEQINCQMPNYS